jgi:hypothetical protein
MSYPEMNEWKNSPQDEKKRDPNPINTGLLQTRRRAILPSTDSMAMGVVFLSMIGSPNE